MMALIESIFFTWLCKCCDGKEKHTAVASRKCLLRKPNNYTLISMIGANGDYSDWFPLHSTGPKATVRLVLLMTVCRKKHW